MVLAVRAHDFWKISPHNIPKVSVASSNVDGNPFDHTAIGNSHHRGFVGSRTLDHPRLGRSRMEALDGFFIECMLHLCGNRQEPADITEGSPRSLLHGIRKRRDLRICVLGFVPCFLCRIK